MPYKFVDGKLVPETDKGYLSVLSSKRELFNALKGQITRAEAAEARAAEWADKFNMVNAELTEAQMELQHIHTMLDDGSGNEGDTALDMVKRLHAEHYALKRELSEAFNSGDGVYRP